MDILTARKIKTQLKLRGVDGIVPEVVRCASTDLFTRTDLKDYDRAVVAVKQEGAVFGKGGVYMTLQLNRDIELGEAKHYVVFAAMAVRAVLSELGVECRVNLPDKILVKGKKICDLKCEFAATPERKAVIIGIRLNVRNDVAKEKDTVTTLAMQAVSAKREELVAMIIKSLLEQEKEYYTKVLESYKAVEATLGKTVKFGKKSGKAVGIDEDGYLLVETSEGVERLTAEDAEIIE